VAQTDGGSSPGLGRQALGRRCCRSATKPSTELGALGADRCISSSMTSPQTSAQRLARWAQASVRSPMARNAYITDEEVSSAGDGGCAPGLDRASRIAFMASSGSTSNS
jgi:hypothetical protein